MYVERTRCYFPPSIHLFHFHQMHPEGCTVSSSSDDNNYSRTFAKPKEIIKVIVLLSWLRQGNLDLSEKPGFDYFKAYFDGSVRLCHPPSQHKLNGATYYTNYKSLMNLADARSITKLTVRYKTYWMEKFVSLMSKKVVKQHSRLDFSHLTVQRLIDLFLLVYIYNICPNIGHSFRNFRPGKTMNEWVGKFQLFGRYIYI